MLLTYYLINVILLLFQSSACTSPFNKSITTISLAVNCIFKGNLFGMILKLLDQPDPEDPRICHSDYCIFPATDKAPAESLLLDYLA